MTSYVLPVALGIVMLSVGLALTIDDFKRVLMYPRAVVVALVCQVVLLPLVCFALVILFRLPPELAVGMMLLAASPGGAVANVVSHLANGDVALNITLTAVNSLLSIVTLPIVLAAALIYFMNDGRIIPPQFSKFLEAFALVLGPVALGMLIRWRFSSLADSLQRPVKIFAALFLVVVAIGAIATAWPTMHQYFPVLGATVVTFNILSLALGYAIPRLLRLDQRQSLAISIEIGMHNGALAIAIALSPMMLNSPAIAAAPGLYGFLSFFITSGFAFLIRPRRSATP